MSDLLFYWFNVVVQSCMLLAGEFYNFIGQPSPWAFLSAGIGLYFGYEIGHRTKEETNVLKGKHE